MDKETREIERRISLRELEDEDLSHQMSVEEKKARIHELKRTYGAFNIIVKKDSPNFIAENQAASTNYQFELRIMTPTSFSDGVIKSNVVSISAAAG